MAADQYFKRRGAQFGEEENPLGGFGAVLSKLLSFLTGDGEQSSETQPTMGLVDALRQFMHAPPIGNGFYKNQQYEAVVHKQYEASNNLTEKTLGLSHTIVAGDQAFYVHAYAGNGKLQLSLCGDSDYKCIQQVELSEKDLGVDKLNGSLERGLKKITEGKPEVQAEVMAEFHRFSATAQQRKEAIDGLQEARESRIRMKEALHIDEQPDKGESKSWKDAWKATDNLRDSLGLLATTVADGKAYAIVPFKNDDNKSFDLGLIDKNGHAMERQVTVASNASRETMREALTQLTAGHGTLQEKVLAKFDHAAAPQQAKQTEAPRQSIEQQLSPDAKSRAVEAAKLGQSHLQDMQHTGNENKTPLAVASNQAHAPQKSIG